MLFVLSRRKVQVRKSNKQEEKGIVEALELRDAPKFPKRSNNQERSGAAKIVLLG